MSSYKIVAKEDKKCKNSIQTEIVLEIGQTHLEEEMILEEETIFLIQTEEISIEVQEKNMMQYVTNVVQTVQFLSNQLKVNQFYVKTVSKKLEEILEEEMIQDQDLTLVTETHLLTGVQGKNTKQFVINVKKTVQFLSNQLQENLFYVKSVSNNLDRN